MPDVPDTTIPLLKGILVNLGGASSEGAAPDTKTQILQKIVQTLGVSVTATADTELSLLRQWIEAEGITYDAAIQTEVEALSVLYVYYGGTTGATMPDHTVPLLKELYLIATGNPDPLVSWEANTGVTSGTIGQPVTAWLSTNGSYTLTPQTPGSEPVHVAGFTTGHAVQFATTGAGLKISNPLTTTVGSIAIVFQATTTTASGRALVSSANSGVSNQYFTIGINSSRRIFIERNDGGTISTVEGSSILTLGTAYVLILTYDGTTYYLTLNGVEENPLVVTSVGSLGWFGSPTGVDEFTVGYQGGATPSRKWDGLIGVVRAWNTDITH